MLVKSSTPYVEHFECGSLIAEGSFGRVNLSCRKTDRLPTVTKTLETSRLPNDAWIACDRDELVPIEVYLLAKLQHPNIIRLLNVFESTSEVQLVFERRSCGMDLFAFSARRPRLDEELAAHLFRQVVDAVSFLHSQGIVHRDVKDENVIVDCSFHCTLIDFGSAAFFNESTLFTQFTGTRTHASPEIVRNEPYRGVPAEVWALGVLLYTLVFLEIPFETEDEVLKAHLRIPESISSDLEDLLQLMLEPNCKFRASMREILQHPWLNQEVNAEDYNFHDLVGDECTSTESSCSDLITSDENSNDCQIAV